MEDVGGVAEGQVVVELVGEGAVEGHPEGLAVLGEGGSHLLHVPLHLEALLPEGLPHVGVRAQGDAVAVEAWLKHARHHLPRPLQLRRRAGRQLTPGKNLRLLPLEGEAALIPQGRLELRQRRVDHVPGAAAVPIIIAEPGNATRRLQVGIELSDSLVNGRGEKSASLGVPLHFSFSLLPPLLPSCLQAGGGGQHHGSKPGEVLQGGLGLQGGDDGLPPYLVMGIANIHLGHHPVPVLLHGLPDLVHQLVPPSLGEGQLLGLEEGIEGGPVLPDDPGVEGADEGVAHPHRPHRLPLHCLEEWHRCDTTPDPVPPGWQVAAQVHHAELLQQPHGAVVPHLRQAGEELAPEAAGAGGDTGGQVEERLLQPPEGVHRLPQQHGVRQLLPPLDVLGPEGGHDAGVLGAGDTERGQPTHRLADLPLGQVR